jgi:hypothetical protein
VVLAERHGHDERRAHVLAALHPDVAAVELDELAHEREADARSFVRARMHVPHALKALEELRQVGFRDADARISHAELDVAHVRAEPDLDLALERELERVREKVQNDLFPHVAVDKDGLRHGLAVDRERETHPLDRRTEHARELRGFQGEIRRFVARLHAARFDAREVEQRVHELEEAKAVAVGQRDRLDDIRRQRPVAAVEQILERTEHQRERCAELVAHVREESRLRAIDLRERRGAAPLGLERARVREARGDLRRDETEERAIRVVERAHRAHACHERGPRPILAGKQHGQHERRVRRRAPGARR